MFFIVAFGLLMLLFRPDAFIQDRISFNNSAYFHPFDRLNRLIAGGIFLVNTAVVPVIDRLQ
jgi:hypothetical protein